MLSQLTIQNFGLIDRLSLEFGKQLNILTGETGAGKSILIDALRIVLGERLNPSQVRNPQDPCILEAVFELIDKDLRKNELMTDFLSGDESTLIIHRTFLPDGRNKLKINGSSVTISQLKEIGNYLVDFHGAHDHQMLLSEDSHLHILDKLIDFEYSKVKYAGVYQEYAALEKQLSVLEEMSSSRERDLDLLRHQVKELEQVPLDESKYQEIIQEQVRLNNAEKLFECVNQLLEIFDAEEAGVNERISQAFGPLRALTQTDESAASWQERLSGVQETVQQWIADVRDYAESLSFDPARAQEINDRYDVYEDIRRKYGPAIEDAQRFYEEARKRYDLLNDLEHNDTELRKKLSLTEKKLRQIAQTITEKRQKACLLLKKTIEKELQDLGIIHVQFEGRIAQGDLMPTGQDQVVFYISPNAGEDLKPLAQIVSSGEAARVMLALKKALIKVDPIPVLIFDEIDAQIGGRLGTITGKKLQELSKGRQVILITHLPQIASFADQHFKVSKSVKAGRTSTNVTLLNADEQVKEIAKMMSGEKETSISVTHAHDMLAKAKK